MDNKELSQQQLKAIELLLKGTSINDIATITGVSRQTISTWKNKNEVFKAELDKSLQDLKSEVNNKILLNIEPLVDKLVRIALKSKSDKTSLDAIIYAINRLCGTPTNKTQEITGNKDNDKDINIDELLSEIKEDNNN
ncbi:carbon monoxide dehydrogenase [Clostridium botulinum]|uniref:helix-turn-helix domain-containing protein n=1 Tax=Clostridium botulinum TaxID=1491 RepID=UPI00016BC03C|nr:helix-turn-helix domain-containing protein [Clostridium botulinum]EDT87221.1 carbon monoxide dehydrogenase large subunit [Clostridium botulinum Bf]MBY6881908.1 helix-turn-helix domain-containing protein [Clostridium botulinum]MBY6889072.1 helix-turn-helix domain-containing protein [Clostridium botulinum]NEZ88180.1 carbon monoxide dehydrogenase [Clostridium botulinum]NFB02705.1 carbon monoxide dehydrogenase [Clostridium botulinum]